MKYRPLDFHVNTLAFTRWSLVVLRGDTADMRMSFYIEDRFYIKDVNRQLSITATLFRSKYGRLHEA